MPCYLQTVSCDYHTKELIYDALEEPCLPENVDTLARVAESESTSISIASGERLFTD